MALSFSDFAYVRGWLKQAAGIVLEEDKAYLVENRLAPLLAQEGFRSVAELVHVLRTSAAHPSDRLHRHVLEFMVITETSFFRDPSSFDALRDTVLPELLTRRRQQRVLNIWSAACASGQEPYSIAMLIREHFPDLLNWKLSITGSDISVPMLERAREGVYRDVEVKRGLSHALLQHYFVHETHRWRLSERVRNMVVFSESNLLGPTPALSRMDCIFLRNVLIYFDRATRRSILERVRERLMPDGYLFLGTTEGSVPLAAGFECVQFPRSFAYRPV